MILKTSQQAGNRPHTSLPIFSICSSVGGLDNSEVYLLRRHVSAQGPWSLLNIKVLVQRVIELSKPKTNTETDF
jgi:hypothetical protein